MLYGIIWLILIQVIGISTFIIFCRFFKTIPDNGYSICKPLGILLLSLSTWLISISNTISVTSITSILLLAAIIIYSAMLGVVRHRDISHIIIRKWRLILSAELIYLFTFLIFFYIRYSDPGINHTEQPMDFAFLNSSVGTVTGQPLDPWFYGETISYYYFGYWIFGTLTKIAFIPSIASYNLALVTIPAMTASTLFTLSAIFTKTSWSKFNALAIFSGLLASSAGVLMGNLQGILEFLRINSVGSQEFWRNICISGMQTPVVQTVDSWRPTEFWWWFKTSRIINHFGPNCEAAGLDYTINEFPFFSYLLGDLHPHVMATPFFLVFVYLAYDLARTDLANPLKNTYLPKIFLIGVILACVCFINMWMVPICIAILIGIHFLKWLSDPKLTMVSMGTSISLILAVGTAILVPYLSSLQTSVTGIEKTQYQTWALHGFLVWAPLLMLTIPQIVWDFWTTSIDKAWKYHIGISIVVVSLPWLVRLISPGASAGSEGPSMISFTTAVTFLCFISTLTLLNVTAKEGISEKALVLSLFSLAMILILIPELFYVGDVYGNRMNTVFKLHYSAWILLALCCGFTTYNWLAGYIRPPRYIKYSYTGLACLIVLSAFYYAPAATMTKIEESGISGFKKSTTAPTTPELSALKYVKENIDISEGILESVGEWDDSGFISRHTGLPNLINWPGHESQWRNQDNEIHKRSADVETIYSTANIDQARSLLLDHKINYVYIGKREINQYTPYQLSKFQHLGTLVFGRLDGVRIFKIKP